MPRRNLIVLLVLTVLSWACYQRAARNRFAATLGRAMDIVATHYINEVDPRVLFEGAMQGMVERLDPYSAYTSPEDYQHFQEQLEGEFTGVGMVLEQDTEHSRLKVVETLIGKPAYVAGIRAGDAVIAIDGKETADIPLGDAVKLIRGQAGTRVKLRVLPAGRNDPEEYELVRAAIPLETVLGDARDSSGNWVYRLASDPRIGYIRVFDNFGERTAEEFRAALATYRQPGRSIDGLVIDLRYNRGGLLKAATDICDMLLDEGVIVTTRGRSGTVFEQYRAAPGTELDLRIPVVVLIDRLSASASEIVAAALQDNGRAAVAGQRSWGKGTVQNVIKLEGGRGALRLTIGSYHRPSGQEIHKWKGAKDSDPWGVRPDSGLEVLLTNAQNERIIQARRKRDFLSWDELARAAPSAAGAAASKSHVPDDAANGASSDPPVPVADGDGPATGKPSDDESSQAARQDTLEIDPQLRRAVEHLRQPSRDGRPDVSRA